MGKGQSLQQMLLGKIDIHMQKNKPLSYTTGKNELKSNHKTWNYTTPKRKRKGKVAFEGVMSAKWQHRNFSYPSPSTHPPKKHQFENELLHMKIPSQKPRIQVRDYSTWMKYRNKQRFIKEGRKGRFTLCTTPLLQTPAAVHGERHSPMGGKCMWCEHLTSPQTTEPDHLSSKPILGPSWLPVASHKQKPLAHSETAFPITRSPPKIPGQGLSSELQAHSHGPRLQDHPRNKLAYIIRASKLQWPGSHQ